MEIHWVFPTLTRRHFATFPRWTSTSFHENDFFVKSFVDVFLLSCFFLLFSITTFLFDFPATKHKRRFLFTNFLATSNSTKESFVKLEEIKFSSISPKVLWFTMQLRANLERNSPRFKRPESFAGSFCARNYFLPNFPLAICWFCYQSLINKHHAKKFSILLELAGKWRGREKEKFGKNVSSNGKNRKLTRYFTTAIDSLKHSIILHFPPAIL